jgi:hypothetical protein
MVIVNVWNYGGFWGIVSGKKNCGHAAVRIITFDRTKPFFISWWPGDDDPNSSKIGPNAPRMPDPHRLGRDMRAEGDKMRNAPAFADFVKKLEKEAKTGAQFLAQVKGKQMTAQLQKELSDHKQRTREVLESLEHADDSTEYQRQYALFERLAQDPNAPPDAKQFYNSLPDPRGRSGDVLRPPDHTVHIPGLVEGNPAGLNEGAIVEWWFEWLYAKNNQHRYRFLAENCSTITALALEAGGAAQLAARPQLKVGGVWTPKTALEYAQAIIAAVGARGKMIDEFVTQHFLSRTVVGGVWSEATFRKESDLGPLAHRYDKLKKIDALLKEYAAIPDHDAVDKLGDRIARLARIIELCQAILTERPDSRRKAALQKLGTQCHEAMILLLGTRYIPACVRTFNVNYDAMDAEHKEHPHV